jgi:thiamine biosynthesis lipoprotein ApbE
MVLKTLARLLWVALIFVWCAGSAAAKELLLTGATMGTTYHIKVVTEPDKEGKDLQQRIDRTSTRILRFPLIFWPSCWPPMRFTG